MTRASRAEPRAIVSTMPKPDYCDGAGYANPDVKSPRYADRRKANARPSARPERAIRKFLLGVPALAHWNPVRSRRCLLCEAEGATRIASLGKRGSHSRTMTLYHLIRVSQNAPHRILATLDSQFLPLWILRFCHFTFVPIYETSQMRRENGICPKKHLRPSYIFYSIHLRLCYGFLA